MLAGINNKSEAIGLDCSIIESSSFPGSYVVSTCDFFYPLVTDPYLQGRVGCSNVLSDCYALGITDIDSVLMILAASLEISKENGKEASDIVTQNFIRGFNDCCVLAGSQLTGGQSVLNPWPMIGGTAKAICSKNGKNSFIEPYFGEIGDCIILTKPLGTQIAVNLKEWQLKNDGMYKNLNKLLEKQNEKRNINKITNTAYNIAQGSMLRLNRNGAKLMQKYKKYCHGATDITGFGIKGHIGNLARHQKFLENSEYFIHTLPIIEGVTLVSDLLKNANVIDFQLLDGFSAETSGGLAIMMDKQVANQFIKDLWEIDGWPAFIIGEIREKQSNVNDNNRENVCTIADRNELNIIEIGYNSRPNVSNRAKL